jgi:peptide/nickel transport system permease protein
MYSTIGHLLKNPASCLGLIIVIAFYGWSALEGLLQLVGMVFHMSSLGWALLPSDPFKISLNQALVGPSPSHLMGTDDLGRDIWSRILYAAPVDAGVSVLVIGGGILVGSVLGLPAGYFGGWTEEASMRSTDLFLAFPALILALVIESTLGRAVIYAIIALVAVWWPSYARLFRGEALRVKSMKFIDAARLSGLSGFEVIARHMVRSTVNTIVSYATIDLGASILVYSVLSFLGFGVPPPAPEWGSMVSLGLEYFPGWWWYSLMPGFVITIVVIGTALLGDGLRDVLAGEL